MSSIRLRLFATLALVTALVWGGAVVWVEIQTRAEVQRVLDRRLMESARMVSSLMQAGSVRPAMQAPESGAADVYDRQLSCQIWSLEGDLIGRSQSAPAERLSEGGDGFSERTIRGERWRVYTVHDRDAGFRVMVGDNLAVREHLVGNVVTALIGPAVLGLLVLGVLIWWSVGRGLTPIRQMTRSLAVRDAEDLTALDVSPDARELRPFALALNDFDVTPWRSATSRGRVHGRCRARIAYASGRPARPGADCGVVFGYGRSKTRAGADPDLCRSHCPPRHRSSRLGARGRDAG